MKYASLSEVETLTLASKVKSMALKSLVLKNCPVLGSRTALFFELLKFCRKPEKIFLRSFFLRLPEKIFEDPFFGDHLKQTFFLFCFLRTLAPVSLVFGRGLEHSCPWPRKGLSSEGLSLALASVFCCALGLGLEPCVLDSTSDYYVKKSQKLNDKAGCRVVRPCS